MLLRSAIDIISPEWMERTPQAQQRMIMQAYRGHRNRVQAIKGHYHHLHNHKHNNTARKTNLHQTQVIPKINDNQPEPEQPQKNEGIRSKTARKEEGEGRVVSVRSELKQQTQKNADDNGEWGATEPIKFVTPSTRIYTAVSQPRPTPNSSQQRANPIYTQPQPAPNSIHRTEIHSSSKLPTQVRGGADFDKSPQRDQNRAILARKTVLLSSSQSALIEVAIVDDQRMLIVAYLMGAHNYKVKTLLPTKQTQEIVIQHSDNWEGICSRVVIEKQQDRYTRIRIKPEVGELELQTKEQQPTAVDEAKARIKSQKDFIQRNYYIFRREHKQVPQEPTPNKKRGVSVGGTARNQELFDRLSAPKRFFRSRQDIRAVTASSKKKIHSRLDPISFLKGEEQPASQKQLKVPLLEVELPETQHVKPRNIKLPSEQEPRQIEKVDKQDKERSQSVPKVESQKPQSQQKQIHKPSNALLNQQSDVEYLDGDFEASDKVKSPSLKEDEDQYRQQQFQNPSGGVIANKMKASDPVKNESGGEYEDMIPEDKGEEEKQPEEDYGLEDFQESGDGKQQLEMKPLAGGISGYADDFQ